MLRGISPLLSPDLLDALNRAGHGDEIVLVDAHFPAASCNARVIRADGLLVEDLLDAILPLFVLDSYVPDPTAMMSPATGDALDPAGLDGFEAWVAQVRGYWNGRLDRLARKLAEEDGEG